MKIKLFVTGGTFDKQYNELNGQLIFKDTHLQEILRLGRCRLAIDLKTLMMIDSLDMSENDRNIILRNCKKSKETKIVITHGTDTMTQTAQLLGENIKDKTIVLTGAMIPYQFGSSDGIFNIASALSFVQALPHGVYIAMNGKYFPWDNVRKNKGEGYFEELDKM